MVVKVEDGTGGDVLCTLQYFKDYCAARGYDISGAVDEELEEALRRGSNYISTGWIWPGTKIGYRVQLLAWPRFSVNDSDGDPVASDSVPHEVADATCEATFYEYENPNGLNPVVTLTDRVSSESVGPISVSYANMGNDPTASRPMLPIITDILKPLLSCHSGTGFTSRANRG